MIYLAAGNSRRFGSNKLCYEIGKKPMFQYGLDTLMQVLKECSETTLTVVTEYQAVREYARKQQDIWRERICVAGSPEHEKGISYSIRAGLANPDADYYLFCVADQPWLKAETVLELICKTVRCGRTCGKCVQGMFPGDFSSGFAGGSSSGSSNGFAGGFVEWNGISGNPTIFSKDLLPELLALEGDMGGKKILLGREDICTVQVREQKELEDVDERIPYETSLKS